MALRARLVLHRQRPHIHFAVLDDSGRHMRLAIAQGLAFKLLVERVKLGGHGVARIAVAVRNPANSEFARVPHIRGNGRCGRLAHSYGAHWSDLLQRSA